MALSDYSFEGQECLCAFVGTLGAGLKNDIKSLVSGVKAIAEVLKALYLLTNINVLDELKKIRYQAELQAIQATTAEIEPPITMLDSYIKDFADCAPAAQISSANRVLRDKILQPVEEREYEIEQLIAALEDNDNESEVLDRIIEVLEDLEEAIDTCE